jgi:multimeric flavodoxin WrbA
MNILFLNGSPKGRSSVTIQTALYLEKRFPGFNYDILNVGQQIKALEKDFTKANEALEKAELILFCYPVYTFIAPYQVHRFIELLKERGVDLTGKYAAQISTSKHFFDVTAQRFIQENCWDLGLRYLGGLSADMDDLQTEKGRYEADCFFEKLQFDIKNGIEIPKNTCPIQKPRPVYQPQLPAVPKKSGRELALVTNAAGDDENLKGMIADFKNACAYPVREINVREFPFAGGCLGCLNCAVSGKCVYRDGFDTFLRTEIQNADGIVLAFTIENHFTHSSMKCYDDRQFCNGHRTVNAGKVTGCLISGDYSREDNLRMIVEARANVSGMYFCGVAGDEHDTANEIENLAKTLDFALTNHLREPQNFYGVGGTKIFRDLVYLMQGIMQADHKFYKSHGIYDFPQKHKGMLWGMKIAGLAMKSPSVQKKARGKMAEMISAPYQKVLHHTVPKENVPDESSNE